MGSVIHVQSSDHPFDFIRFQVCYLFEFGGYGDGDMALMEIEFVEDLLETQILFC